MPGRVPYPPGNRPKEDVYKRQALSFTLLREGHFAACLKKSGYLDTVHAAVLDTCSQYPTRMEYGENWYLVGIRAEDLNGLRVRI